MESQILSVIALIHKLKHYNYLTLFPEYVMRLSIENKYYESCR